ncbi:SCO family protein [Novosphingobium pokkalii]|uniref:SCO family protein n=1 Tax=Novosphingobium pokkalii TaxID=1770194 RepID=A0ABV7V316_9SPHN|nr:SCO family protein [Novosphingobium pokkalii]GHD04005.1 hypothetical protein GCM10019060_40530 [Novosphingobium pokkalii]
MPDIEESKAGQASAGARWPWRAGLVLLAAAAGFTGLALGINHFAQAPSQDRQPAIGGPFTLTAPDGKTVTEQALAGKPFAIFFGFTRCPDVCPTSLARMARLREKLGADGLKFAIVFVSVDVGRDKPADLGRYVGLFGTPILGLTGTQAQIDAIKRGYGVYSAKVSQPGGDYTIDHTAAIYLMDRHGQFANLITYDEPDDSALAKLKALIAQA